MRTHRGSSFERPRHTFMSFRSAQESCLLTFLFLFLFLFLKQITIIQVLSLGTRMLSATLLLAAAWSPLSSTPSPLPTPTQPPSMCMYAPRTRIDSHWLSQQRPMTPNDTCTCSFPPIPIHPQPSHTHTHTHPSTLPYAYTHAPLNPPIHIHTRIGFN